MEETTKNYLTDLVNQGADKLYRKAIDQIEKPLLEIIMIKTNGNQSKAAICLGINRITLKAKLKRHKLWFLTKKRCND